MSHFRQNSIVFLFFFFFSFYLFAQDGTINPYLFIASPPSPVGSGARAMGVGGAFIAVADDATSASWNPGALIQLELPEATMVYTYDARQIEEDNVDFYDVNYLSVSYPFTVKGTNMIFSFNYQRLYDFYARAERQDKGSGVSDLAGTWMVGGTGAGVTRYDVISLTGMKTGLDLAWENYQRGEVGAIAPAFAIQITPEFSLGFTFNFWRDGWLDKDKRYLQEYEEQGDGELFQESGLWWDVDGNCTCSQDGDPACTAGEYIDDPSCLDELIDPAILGGPNPTKSGQKDLHWKFSSLQRIRMEGENFNIGILWDLTGRWTLGVVFRSGFKMRVKRTYSAEQTQSSNTDPSLNFSAQVKEEYNEAIYFPSSQGIGVGYRYSDALSFTADLTQVRWDEYYYELANDTKYSPVTGLKKGIDDVDPTLTFRAGGEYLFIRPRYVVPIRAGFFYDQQPARKHPDDFWGITIGSGFVYKWLVFDLTYYYRWGRDVLLNSVASADHTELISEEKGDIDQHMVMMSFIFHFE